MNQKSLENTTQDAKFVEPVLKYKRVPNAAKDIMDKDSISCLAVHAKFMAIGTDWGNIHILDHLGYPCRRMIDAHSTIINQLSIDSDGEHIASCSDDGKVMVFGLLDDKHYLVISFNREIKAVAIAPDFKRSFNFVTGDTRLILVSKGILTNHKHKTLQDNRTRIRNIKWRGDMVIYATDDSAFVYDMKEQKLIGIIEPNRANFIPNSKEFYCRIFWINDDRFIIGWGHLIQMCQIRETSIPTQLPRLDHVTRLMSSNKVVDSLHSFSHPDQILGIANYNQYILAVVDPVSTASLNLSETMTGQSLNQTLMILVLEPVTTNPDKYLELTTDQILTHTVGVLKDQRTHLEKLPDENEFYIGVPKDLISVKERNIDDRIKWFIDNKLYTNAMELLAKTPTSETKYTYRGIGMEYLEHLLKDKNNFQEAANVCTKIVDDKKSWEMIIEEFLKVNAIGYILPYVPISEESRLDQEIYMKIMYQCFQTLPLFVNLLKTWPSSLYSIPKILDLINKDDTYRQRLTQKSSESLGKQVTSREKLLLECLAVLYENNHEYKKALDFYMQLNSPYVFELIPRRNMYDTLKEKLIYLIQYDRQKTLELLMDQITYVPPDTIVKILQPTPALLVYYLDELKLKNCLASEPYHSQLIHLYATFKKEKLLSFLKSSDKYDLNTALNLCKEWKFYDEQIYLLGRMGKSKEALDMIMTQSNEVSKSISYCQEHNDPDLWAQLTTYSLNKPEFIKAILENTTEEIDTKLFVRRILNGTDADDKSNVKSRPIEIPGLKSSLVRLLVNNEKRSNLLTSHQTARWRNLHQMLTDQLSSSKTPIICELGIRETECLMCQKPLLHFTGQFVMLKCGHYCHWNCLESVVNGNATTVANNKLATNTIPSITGLNNIKIISKTPNIVGGIVDSNNVFEDIIVCSICSQLF